MGSYHQSEDELKHALRKAEQFRNAGYWYQDKQWRLLNDLGSVSGLQGKGEVAKDYFQQALRMAKKEETDYARGMIEGFYGAVCLRLGEYTSAQTLLESSRSIKRQRGDTVGMPELLYWLGEIHERLGKLKEARDLYEECLKFRNVGRRYFESSALTGLVRLAYALGQNIQDYTQEAEQLARHYEYNDQLAWIRLIQGHSAWDNPVSDRKQAFEEALRFYQAALVHAVRYQRFLLDEVLSGRPQGLAWHAIIPHCLQRGDEGRSMLSRLSAFWQNGLNEITIQAGRNDGSEESISLIPAGIPLRDAERIAREGEPGDGSHQPLVLEQLRETSET